MPFPLFSLKIRGECRDGPWDVFVASQCFGCQVLSNHPGKGTYSLGQDFQKKKINCPKWKIGLSIYWRVNLTGVEPDRVKLSISSHVTCDPIPRVEYI